MHSEFLKHYNIQCNADKCVELVHSHIDAVVHHIVSLSAMVAMLGGKKKIEHKHLQDVKMYVITKCGGHLKGGMSMASDFYGYPHPAYASSNANAGVHVSEIHWGKQEARPSQGPTQSGGAFAQTLKYKKELQNLVKTHLSHIAASISKGALKELVDIIDIHLVCFANDLIKESPLTVKKVEKILSKRRHKAFMQ